ncbi:MAG: hypothetical protein LBT44_02955 [Clostridiales bacterium]|jgi:hypothetical protein|nr:hypothetical protein [Clostridiales bacterium]
MGQYYTALVIDESNKVTKLSPRSFDSFSKLTEHSWIGNDFVNAVYSLIHNRRRKVAWIGDYAMEPYLPDEDPYARMMPVSEFKELYDLAHGDKNGISSGFFFSKDLSCLDYDTTGMFLVNHDLAVYLDIAEYIKQSSVMEKDGPWCLSPLPLLTACGNGRGGGDFHESHTGYDDVGIWAFNRVEYTDKIPDGYHEAKYRFAEDGGVGAFRGSSGGLC